MVSTNLDSLKRFTLASNSALILKSSTLLLSFLNCHRVDRKDPVNHTTGKFRSSEESKLSLSTSAWVVLGKYLLMPWRRKFPVPGYFYIQKMHALKFLLLFLLFCKLSRMGNGLVRSLKFFHWLVRFG